MKISPKRAALVVAALGVCSSGACRAREPLAARPDIVLITIDTLRADRVGVYGSARGTTPVLDSLAARGTRFVDVVATTPLTLPSHASILSGASPLAHGVRDNVGFAVPSTLPIVSERFAAAGYDTAAFVSGFPLHRRFGLSRGFATYDDRFTTGRSGARAEPVERAANDTVAAVAAWTQRPHADAPLFLWVHFFDPHAPYEPPEPFKTQFAADPYDGEVAFVDQQIGVLLDRLARARPGRRSVVVVTADHGEGLGDHREPTHGLFVYDSTLRVPLIAAGPGIAEGKVVTAGVRLVDIAPTVLDVAGLPPFDGIEGESLGPALTRADASIAPRAAYAESLFGELCCGWAPLHAWRDRGLMFIDAPRPELYDLAADPGQQHNVAADRPDAAARLRRALDAARATERPASRDAAATADVRDRLRSLGYAGGGGAQRPTMRDPKDMIDVSTTLGEAVEIEETDPARAASVLAGVLRTDPTNAMARRHLGVALLAQRRYKEAGDVLRVLAASGDRTNETALLLADAAIGRGDLAEARTLLERVHAANRDDAAVTFKLAVIVARTGNAAVAIPLFADVVERRPEDADARVDLASALLDSRRGAEAIPHFERALALGANTPLVLNGLGSAKLQAGDSAGAADAFQRSLRLDPNQPEIAAALARIRIR